MRYYVLHTQVQMNIISLGGNSMILKTLRATVYLGVLQANKPMVSIANNNLCHEMLPMRPHIGMVTWGIATEGVHRFLMKNSSKQNTQ